MIVPPKRSASARAAVDLQLAVGPAIRMASSTAFHSRTSQCRRRAGLADRNGDEAQFALGIGEQEQDPATARFPDRTQPRQDIVRLAHGLLGNLHDHVANLDMLLRGRTSRRNASDHDPFDLPAYAKPVAQRMGQWLDRQAKELALPFVRRGPILFVFG